MSLPSPTPSLSESSATNSKKRVRSPSMVAEDPASSPKRALSEVPSLESTNIEPSSSSLASTGEEDTYMQAQGDQEGEVLAPPPPPAAPAPVSTFSGADKLSLIENFKKVPMEPGQVWSVISSTWYKRFRKACTGEVDKAGGCTEADLGPVDNTDICDPDGVITHNTEGMECEFFPKEAFHAFQSWYGECPRPLNREVVLSGDVGNYPSLELYPLRFKVFQLAKPEDRPGPPPVITISRKKTVSQLYDALMEALAPEPCVNFRVWQIPDPADMNVAAVDPEKIGSSYTLIKRGDKSLEEMSVLPEDQHMVEFQVNNKWTLPTPEEVETPAPLPLFSTNTNFFGPNFPSNEGKPGASSKLATAFSTSNERFKPPVVPLRKIEPGTLGLGNMGNTCFMNSALQCLLHTKELAEYFQLNVHVDELNPDNPLGMKGAIAESFAELVKRVWAESSAGTSFVPREFKSQLQRFAPQFSGYQQHDSQELVAFLLDGLHEDLNRVLQKPYVEKPDWEGGGLREVVKLAQNSWDGYMKRNDSVIVDLFQGQYQSTLVCPECKKVSITFDPFMYLTLPLPVKKMWEHTLHYVPWDLEKPHLKMNVTIGRDASFKELRQLIGRWMDVPAENLLTLEVWKTRFYKNLHDGVLCTDMLDNDIIVCFELPCNSQQSRTYKRSPEDPTIIPVLFANLIPGRLSSPDEFGVPTLAVIPANQTSDTDAIHEAVTRSIARWTKAPDHLYTWEQGDSVDADAIPVDSAVVEIHVAPEEGDIVDEKRIDEDAPMAAPPVEIVTGEPRKVESKKETFELFVYADAANYAIGAGLHKQVKPDAFQARLAETPETYFREKDAIVVAFDANMKEYFFGDRAETWENNWTDHSHPEYEAAKKAALEASNKTITLRDCLDEFTKKEKLGEDDLWYCPECKKHQQASKQFELWKAPDVLVVHLKRFSNSRLLRDKIDDLVEFPTEGLDLGDMVGERKIAMELTAAGEDISDLGLGNLDEELVYDLFGVDEHMGGLSGGHYRAYAMNHLSGKWHHFDDAHVRPAEAKDSITSSAYLLFYRRRTQRPLGGKTNEKIVEARLNPKIVLEAPQLPTPPNEPSSSFLGSAQSRLGALSTQQLPSPANSGSTSPVIPELTLPAYEDDDTFSNTYAFPDSSRASPSTSNEADGGDMDDYDGSSMNQWDEEENRLGGDFNGAMTATAQRWNTENAMRGTRGTTPAPESCPAPPAPEPIPVPTGPPGPPTDFEEIE